MADLKVTKMVMKVDLQCSKCYRKIKKVLCRIPQIRDQVYDEKQNTVTITVVCCSPEKVKEKIACKAGDTVESIEIVPDKPKEKPKELPKPDKPKVTFIEPPKAAPTPPATAPAPAPATAPKTTAPKTPAPDPTPAPKAPAPKTPAPDPTPAPKAPAPKTPAPASDPAPPPKAPVPVVQGFPQPPQPGPVPIFPVGVCCCCCCCDQGRPCHHGRPPMCYDGCGRPAYECSGGSRGYYVSRCDEYFSEENASGCHVM